MKQTLTLLLVSICAINSFATAPTVPASNLAFHIIEGSYVNMGWTAGNGTRRIIIARAGQAVSAVPQNGVDYQENTNFGSGQQIEAGQYIVYDNAFTSFYLTGLLPNTQYFFAVYEYNGTGAATEYLVNSKLTGSSYTASTPLTQASQFVFSNIKANSVTLSFTAGTGLRRLVLAREAAAVNANPIDLHPYSGNTIFGSGAQAGTGNFSVSSGSATFMNITNLKAGTAYHFAVFEYNGNNEPVFLVPGATGSFTTRTVPTVASSNLVISKPDGKELTLAWTKGNGQRRIVVAKQGSMPTTLPVSGTDYTANEQFGSGSSLAAGEWVVYNGTGSSMVLSGLSAGNNYYFRIYEFDGTGNTTSYLTAAYAQGNGTTANTPTQQSANIVASNIQATSMSLSWQNGNGRARLVLMRKGSAVNALPQNFTAYTTENNFGTGPQLGAGNYIISNSAENYTSVHNLEPNTLYHVAVFEFNGYNQPLYLSPAATFSVSTSGSLPVILSAWSAVLKDDAVQLNWTTQTEINFAHFNIQRSSDGISYHTIQNKTAKGNSNVVTNYTAIDINPLPGKNYYRLEMVDRDGSSKYSAVITVDLKNNQPELKLQQNKTMVVAKLTGGSDKAKWILFNSAGQVLKTSAQNSNDWQLDIAALAPGIYIISANIQGKILSGKFAKQ